MQVYRIPSNEYTSFIVIEEGPIAPILFHGGKITRVEAYKETLMGGTVKIYIKRLAFIVPPEKVNCSFPTSMDATVLLKEINPRIIRAIVQAIKINDPNAILFEPSPVSRGSRIGYVFKMGDQGLGYYLDRKKLLRDIGQDLPSFDLSKIYVEEEEEPTEMVWSASGELESRPIQKKAVSYKPDQFNPMVKEAESREFVLSMQRKKLLEKEWGPDALPISFQ